MTKTECPDCGKTQSNSGKEFTQETLEQHRRDAHPEDLMYPGLTELSDEFSDLPDGAFGSIAMERGVL